MLKIGKKCGDIKIDKEEKWKMGDSVNLLIFLFLIGKEG